MARSSLYPDSVRPGIPVEPTPPPGWELRTFGEMLTDIERPVGLVDDKTYQLVTVRRNRGGVVERERLSGDKILTKTAKRVEAGDFLISKRQIIHGACGVVPDELEGSVVSNEYISYRVKPGLLLGFLKYFSHTPYFQMTTFHSSIGVDVEKMVFRQPDWERHRFLLPPLHEQKRIAEILSSVDESIRATKAVIEQTKKVKQGLLQQLLTKGIGHTRFKQTEIGEIPESWEVVRLGDVCDRITKGESPRWQGFEYQDDGTMFVTSENVRDGFLDLSSPKFIPWDFGEKLSRSKLSGGDVLVNIVGASIGRAAVWREGTREANVNQAVAVVTPRSGVLLGDIVVACLYSDIGLRHFGTTKVDNARPNVSLGSLRAFKVPLVPIEEQRRIVEVLRSVDVLMDLCCDSVHTQKSNKAGLMQDLLTGKVRV